MLAYLSAFCFFVAAISTGDCYSIAGPFSGKNDSLGPHIVICTLPPECYHEGRAYHVGETFPSYMGECMCTWYDGIECKMEVCEHKGASYRVGQTFMDDCNECSCEGNNVVRCTKKICLTTDTGCAYNNKIYKIGESYMKDCNTCICEATNAAVCTGIFCIFD
ncbi:kielin/chordin-like protein [Octopus sinensis]|uniref:Kielin/chordin-like protein n=1 Tax=Octopus sinensis TaxID=2607531 RepID=A0A6P7TLG5_9MOLL|nr:kielin/chordin-like protein [Octopus sinensis]